jgi:hypothetical protein
MEPETEKLVCANFQPRNQLNFYYGREKEKYKNFHCQSISLLRPYIPLTLFHLIQYFLSLAFIQDGHWYDSQSRHYPWLNATFKKN